MVYYRHPFSLPGTLDRRMSEIETYQLSPESSDYPPALRCWLDENALPTLTLQGDCTLLQRRIVAIFSSSQCPEALIMRARLLAHQMVQHGITVISGFHSPVERECLTVLLHGTQPLILCPARSIVDWRLPAEYRPPWQAGRLLIISPFSRTQRRISIDTAMTRNLIAAALADTVLIVHAALGSKTGAFCREVLRWGKPVHTFASDHNANLIKQGAQVVRSDTEEALLAAAK